MATKTKNPQDITLRNIRAANKKIKDLEDRIDCLESSLKEAIHRIFDKGINAIRKEKKIK